MVCQIIQKTKENKLKLDNKGTIMEDAAKFGLMIAIILILGLITRPRV